MVGSPAFFFLKSLSVSFNGLHMNSDAPKCQKYISGRKFRPTVELKNEPKQSLRLFSHVSPKGVMHAEHFLLAFGL